MTRIDMHISKVKLPFYHPCEVKCELQNWVLTEPKNSFCGRLRAGHLDQKTKYQGRR